MSVLYKTNVPYFEFKSYKKKSPFSYVNNPWQRDIDLSAKQILEFGPRP